MVDAGLFLRREDSGRGSCQIMAVDGASTSVDSQILANTSQRATISLELKERIFYVDRRTIYFMTPSLANFLYSLLAGGLVVVVPATIGLIFISQKDKIQRS